MACAQVPLSLKGRALRLLSGREYSRSELEHKLSAYEETPEQLKQVIDELEAKGFISEKRVLASVINRRAGKLGNARILHELQQKGLSAELLCEARAELKTTELGRAREVWRKKFDAPAQDAASRAKQMRFLLSRGFGAEIVRQVIQCDDGGQEWVS